ncbi:MAG: imidazole glycerol phosphate synthase subunit HisH [Hyperthermus sp.]|nr:MAG: imidazole glycerol phosphate synthase subunit HisH [Hyperthermus sp.]
MAPRIAIIKYGVGNIYSMVSGLRRAGGEPHIVGCIRDPGEWDGIVLPGVGAFEAATARLHECSTEIREALRMGAQLLGVCLGLQLLLNDSREEGFHSYGLSMLPGTVTKLVAPKLPHIGWSPIRRIDGRSCSLLDGIEDGERFYFVHSYALAETRSPWICALSTYGFTEFAAVIEQPPLYATQFHPERSGKAGLRVLTNWVSMLRR